MAEHYNGVTHSHVTISNPHLQGNPHPDHPEDREVFRGTFPLILHVGDYVWVAACYLHLDARWPEIKMVSDGRSDGYDHHGGCVISVPASWCKFYDEEDAAMIDACIDADDRLRSYAY